MNHQRGACGDRGGNSLQHVVRHTSEGDWKMIGDAFLESDNPVVWLGGKGTIGVTVFAHPKFGAGPVGICEQARSKNDLKRCNPSRLARMDETDVAPTRVSRVV